MKISSLSYAMLHVLSAKGALRVSDVVLTRGDDREYVRIQSMYAALDQLETLGAVKCSWTVEHDAIMLWKVTEYGRNLLKELMRQ